MKDNKLEYNDIKGLIDFMIENQLIDVINGEIQKVKDHHIAYALDFFYENNKRIFDDIAIKRVSQIIECLRPIESVLVYYALYKYVHNDDPFNVMEFIDNYLVIGGKYNSTILLDKKIDDNKVVVATLYYNESCGINFINDGEIKEYIFNVSNLSDFYNNVHTFGFNFRKKDDNFNGIELIERIKKTIVINTKVLSKLKKIY